MKLLQDNFEITKYGLHCRLVNEKDAEFIIQLRSDNKRSRFIHATDSDVNTQIKWIKEYKNRQFEGKEYYFIYDIDDIPFGVNRIYDIQVDHCTEGSWVCMPIEDSSKSISSALIIRDIIFEVFGFDYDYFNVSVGNNKVKKFHIISGATIIEETPEEYLFKLTREDYLKNRQWFLDTYKLSLLSR